MDSDNITQDFQINKNEIKILQLLGDRVANLQSKQALNHNDLPLSYIDPQAIVATGLIREITASEINNAIIPLDYLEGYPVVNGLPFWEKLDGELLYFYRLFKSYRDMKEEIGSRSLQEVANRSEQPFLVISNMAKALHWHVRVKAYDIYRNTQLEHIRRTNIEKMTNKHHDAANMIFDKIQEIIKDVLEKMKNNPDPNRTPEYQTQLRCWFREAVKLDRLSLGLSIDKPSEINETAGNIITNYNLNHSDNRQVNVTTANKKTEINTNKMEAVLNVLNDAGVLDQLIESKNSPSGGNGHKEGQLIDINRGANV